MTFLIHSFCLTLLLECILCSLHSLNGIVASSLSSACSCSSHLIGFQLLSHRLWCPLVLFMFSVLLWHHTATAFCLALSLGIDHPSLFRCGNWSLSSVVGTCLCLFSSPWLVHHGLLPALLLVILLLTSSRQMISVIVLVNNLFPLAKLPLWC